MIDSRRAKVKYEETRERFGVSKNQAVAEGKRKENFLRMGNEGEEKTFIKVYEKCFERHPSRLHQENKFFLFISEKSMKKLFQMLRKELLA
jgi:hypothetical protein